MLARPRRHHGRHLVPRPRILLPVLVIAALAAALVTGSLSATAQAAGNTSQFKGVNWADPRDNFVNDSVVPSGLATSDSYATTYAKASAILSGFQTNLGANTVRFGMNDRTVSSAWWNSYVGALDATLDKGMNVMIAPWAYPGSCGCVTDTAAFYRMWDTVINRYLGKPGVYFEIFNEPNGYSDKNWDNFAAGFVAHYPNVPRGRIVVAGSGSGDSNLATVGADSRLSGTLLSLHLYSVFGISHNTEAAWVTEFDNHLHGYGSRTIVTEFGVPMSTGVNYNGPRDGDNNRSYYYALTDTMHSQGIGSIYWPGLRNGDSWSMEQLHGSGTNLSLTTVNASGRDRLEYAWGNSAPSSSPSPSPSKSPSSSPSSSPGGGTGCTAAYTVTNTWPGGYQATVTVTNQSSTPTSGWTVRWTLPNGQTISQVWNGTLAVNGSTVTVANVSYNAVLAAGASTTFGLIGNGSATPTPAVTCSSS